jgi:hypothetical protein
VFLPEAPLPPLLLPLCSFFLAFSFCYKHFKTFLSHISLESFGRKDVSLNYFLFLVDVERERGDGISYTRLPLSSIRYNNKLDPYGFVVNSSPMTSCRLIRASSYKIPSHLRSIYAILAVESMEVWTNYHLTQAP